MNDSQIIAIAALGKETLNICREDKLLWRIPEDLKRVKSITMGHPLIMGRKTFESIGKPLPGRENIVLTKNTQFFADGIRVAHSPEEALEIARSCEGGQQIYIFGGAEIYRLFLPYTSKLLLTLVSSDKEGTAQFPEYEGTFTVTDREEGGIFFDEDTQTECPYEWVTLERNQRV